MKSIKRIGLALIVLTLALLSSCSKEKLRKTSPFSDGFSQRVDLGDCEESITVTGEGILYFPTRSCYDITIDSLAAHEDGTDAIYEDFEAQYNFNSMRKYYDGIGGRPIDNEILATLITTKGLIKIENWYLKVSISDSTVYALDENMMQSGDLDDLADAPATNPRIDPYSMSLDVLDILIDGGTGGRMEGNNSTPQICWESGIGGYDVFTDEYTINHGLTTYKFRGKLHFNKFGIFFNLFSEVLLRLSTSNSPATLCHVKIIMEPVYYHARCGVTAGPYNTTSQTNNGYGYKRYQSYQGSKNLNEVYFRGKFQALDVITNAVVQETEYRQIRVNY